MSETSQQSGKPAKLAVATGVFIAAMCAVALAAHAPQLAVVKFAATVAAGLAVAVLVVASRDPLRLLALTHRTGQTPGNMLYYAAFGVAVALVYRLLQGHGMLPPYLTLVALSAAAIGALEEVAYRGFVQGALEPWGRWPAILAAAAAHTAYKCCLFVIPDGPHDTHITTLAAGTLALGIALGWARQKYHNLLLPILAHSLFDALVYGDLATLPWWTR